MILIARLVPPLSHLTSCAPTKSNLYFDSSLAAVFSDPDLYRLFTFQVPNPMYLSVAYVVPKICATSRLFIPFRNTLRFGLCRTLRLQDHLLSVVRFCLLNIFAHVWKPYPPFATRGLTIS